MKSPKPTEALAQELKAKKEQMMEKAAKNQKEFKENRKIPVVDVSFSIKFTFWEKIKMFFLPWVHFQQPFAIGMHDKKVTAQAVKLKVYMMRKRDSKKGKPIKALQFMNLEEPKEEAEKE